MCRFITVIAKAKNKNLISDALIQVGRRADLIDNPSLRKVMGEDEIPLLTTNGMCDCDTVLGFDPQEETNKLDAEIKKLRRKKWSQSKIDRYLFDREKKFKKVERSKTAQGGDSIAMWTDVISTALNGGASEVGLFFFRMYRGIVECEIFQVDVMKVDFCNFGEAEFTTMEESAIYYFR